MTTKNKDMILKKLLLANLFALLLAVPCYGQSVNDEQVVTFQFRAEKDMFSVSEGSNRSELQRLNTLVEQYRSEINNGEMPVYVNGYCTSLNSEDENLATARIRSNRVKSQLITTQKLKEPHFITLNQAIAYQGNNNMVTVTLRIPQKEEAIAYNESAPEEVKETQTVQIEDVAQSQSQESGPQASGEPQIIEEPLAAHNLPLSTYHLPLFFRTNLLHWLAGVPNVGFEYQVCENIGLLLNGGWSHWTGKTADKQHRIWYVSPELRYYLGDAKRWYLGLEGHAGQFNLKLNDTGRQFDLLGGGLTGGYKLTLSRVFDLDFNLGFGYTQLKDYEKYTQTNGVYVRTQPIKTKDYWGLTQAGVSLVWKIN
jgi:Hemolysin activation/secretion protein